MISTTSKWRFATSLALGVAATVLFIAWIDASEACEGMPTKWLPGKRCLLVKFFYDWQQLLGGLFALAAAAVGWVAINRQVRQVDEQERERLRRRYDAARAVLPLALSSIHEYASQCAASLLQVHLGQARNTSVGVVHWRPPPVPSSTMVELREMIEVSSPAQATPITRLLSRIQVQAARLYTMSCHFQQGAGGGTMQYLGDTIEIAALASALFKYARGLEDSPSSDEPSRDEMKSAAVELGVDANIAPIVHSWIDSRYKAKA